MSHEKNFYPSSDEGVTTTAPYRRRVGQEIELDTGPNGDQAFTRYVWENGTGTPPLRPTNNWWSDLCPAHCGCEKAFKYPIHTTRETVGGEHIIGGPQGVLFGSPAYMTAIGAVADAAAATGNRGGVYTGGHTHVSIEDYDVDDALRFARNVVVLWPRVREIATGQWDQTRNPSYSDPKFGVRVINADLTGYHQNHVIQNLWGSGVQAGNMIEIMSLSTTFRFFVDRDRTFREGRRKTVEWRVWNTMVSRWRLYMAAGVSSAIVEAAKQGRVATDTMTLEDHLDGLLTEDLLILLDRQRAITSGDTAWAA